MIWPNKSFGLFLALLVSVLITACASSRSGSDASDGPVSADQVKPLSFAANALAFSVNDTLAARPSWVYYQYGLEAMDNQEWLLAKHYLDEAMRQLVTEKYDTLLMKSNAVDDSLYVLQMPLRVVQALDEIYPKLVNPKKGNFQQNEVVIEGVDALDEKMADKATLQTIENFLDTIDVSGFTLPLQLNDRVLQEIYYMTTSAKSFMSGSLNRMTAYDSLIYSKLDDRRMPRDLIYLALVESGFKVRAYSRAKASGMWQFIPVTGMRYGLEVSYWVDMRRDVEQATGAALSYLQYLHDEFDDWLLAMAAYNCGEGRVHRLINEMKADSTRDSTAKITYWDLSLPKETMHYVPRILAAMVIGHYPWHYEMQIKPQQISIFDTVSVFDSYTFEEISRITRIPVDTLSNLNPELIKSCTPPNRDSYILRIPVGKRENFVKNYGRMKRNLLTDWHRHKVRRGESLGSIAQKYGIRLVDVQKANNMKSSKLKIGQILLVPIKVKPKNVSTQRPSNVRTHTVELGENLASIARHYGISQESLRTWNSISENTSLIKAGEVLYVSKPDAAVVEKIPDVQTRPKPRPKLMQNRKYVVKPGDTFAEIAKTFDVPLFQLLFANAGFSKRLVVGDSITIPLVAPRPQAVATSASSKSEAGKASKKESSKSTSSKDSKTTVLYTVQQGDNLLSIAKKFSTTVETIRSMNNMNKSSESIRVGQKLKLPSSASVRSCSKSEIIHKVKRGEGLWDIARQYNVSIEEIVKLNKLNGTKIKVGQKLKIKPKSRRK